MNVEPTSPRSSLFPKVCPGRDDWARGVALFLAVFTTLNLLGEWRWPGFDANEWWLDLRGLPKPAAWSLLAAGAAFLAAFALRPVMRLWRRRMTCALAGSLAVAAAVNGITFYRLLAGSAIRSAWPVPLSLLILGALLLVIRSITKPLALGEARLLPAFRVGVTLGASLVLFPLAQVIFFGNTDYRRQADAVIVLGARAYADGRPSDALADRVRTGCQLYLDGLVKQVIFSGGPGDGAIHETESMRRLAIQLGVPSEAILLDPHGLNTRATIANSKTIVAREGVRDALVVSHFYHLPRIKLAAQRAGLNVRTVPARQAYYLRQTPAFVGREVVALWVYYLRPLAASSS